MNLIRLSHGEVTLDVDRDCNTASLHQAMRSIVYVLLLVARWFSYRCPSISINLPVGIWCSLIGPH